MKKTNKKIVIFIIIAIIVIGAILLIIGISSNNKEYTYKGFQHRNTKKLDYEMVKATESYEADMGYYEEVETFSGNISDGDYYSAKLYYKFKTIIIEENIIDVEYDESVDGDYINSILYSNKKLNNKIIETYLNQMHDGSRCGVHIEKIKEIKSHYYRVQFYNPDDC